jgi:N-acetylglucosamine-6-phosphate deacetylase
LTSTVLTADHVVVPGAVHAPGWVWLEGDRIVGAASGPAPAEEPSEHVGTWLLPGFVDLHVHGGGGHDVGRSADEALASARFHQQHGTTATLLSLAAAPIDRLVAQLRAVADLVEAGPAEHGVQVLGAHLEGPFLSPARCGAIDGRWLLPPDAAVLDELLAAGRGTVRTITLAPELPGALELIDRARAAGVVVAVGHTDATYDQALAGFHRGATAVTHLCNAMRPMHHREPGPILAAHDGGAACEVINDGVHVHPAVLRMVHGWGADRPVLVTDAVVAAGLGDGEHRFDGRVVTVADGQVRLADGTLAGSTLTADVAVRRALEQGLPPIDVALAAATNPARVIGEGDRRGAITAGLAADLVVLGEDLTLERVMVAGAWVR